MDSAPDWTRELFRKIEFLEQRVARNEKGKQPMEEVVPVAKLAGQNGEQGDPEAVQLPVQGTPVVETSEPAAEAIPPQPVEAVAEKTPPVIRVSINEGDSGEPSRRRREKFAEPVMPSAFGKERTLSIFELWVTEMENYLSFFERSSWFPFAVSRLEGVVCEWYSSHQQERSLHGLLPISSWEELKEEIRHYLELYAYLESVESTRERQYSIQPQKLQKTIILGEAPGRFPRRFPYKPTGSQNFGKAAQFIRRTDNQKKRSFGNRQQQQQSSNRGDQRTRPTASTGSNRTTTTTASTIRGGGVGSKGTAPGIICYQCGQPGHISQNCPQCEGVAVRAMEIAETMEADETVEAGEDMEVAGAEEAQLEADTNEGPEVSVPEAVLDHGDYLPWVEVNMGGEMQNFLIDTRADINVLDLRVVNAMGLKKTRIVNPYLIKFVQGSTTIAEKVVSVPITIGNTTRKHDFLVMDLGGFGDGILSWAWLQKCKAKVDVPLGVVTLIDKWGVEHSQKMVVKASPEGSTSTIRGFQSARIAFQVCTARRFGRQIKTAEEAWVVVVSKEAAETGEEERVAAMPVHPDMQRLIDRYQHIMPEHLPPRLPPRRALDHAIDIVPDSQPTAVPSRRMSYDELKELKNQLKELVAQGILRSSISPYAAPVLFVAKRDGGIRMCADYRALNKITVKNKYPLPLMEECTDRLATGKYFTKLDLRSGYHQIRIKEGDEEKTAVRTRYGLFEYTVLQNWSV
ncbi:hypothetical protein R1sor_017405 [Riccia sorocarpa]|uniref:CCHC-type domain-containing protein n=1 Tax=Riccia sorocarpa TaxID=122646 RepID=A0ABD3I757_9MARC